MQETGKKIQIDFLVAFRFTGGVLIFLALFSQGILDPTPTNLVWSETGIKNWFGLIGSLASGFLLENFGILAYSIPVSLCLLDFNSKSSLLLSFNYSVLQIFTLTIISPLLFPSTLLSDQGLYGWIGYSGYYGCIQLLGRYISIILLFLLIIFTFHRTIIYKPLSNLILSTILIVRTLNFNLLQINFKGWFGSKIKLRYYLGIKLLSQFSKMEPVFKKLNFKLRNPPKDLVKKEFDSQPQKNQESEDKKSLFQKALEQYENQFPELKSTSSDKKVDIMFDDILEGEQNKKE